MVVWIIGKQGKDSGAEIVTNTCLQITLILLSDSKLANSCIKCQKYEDLIQNTLPEAVQLSKELMLDQQHSNCT